MAAPANGTVSLTSIEITWAALTTSAETGDSSIDSYHAMYDSGTSGATWTDLVG